MKHVLVLLTIALSARAASISLSYTSPVPAGSNFDVAVQANNLFSGLDPGDVLLAYGFNVNLGNSPVVSYTGETAGALFADISSELSGTPQVAGIGAVGPGDFTGPLTLAVLHFEAVSAGSTTIELSANLEDLNQGL